MAQHEKNGIDSSPNKTACYLDGLQVVSMIGDWALKNKSYIFLPDPDFQNMLISKAGNVSGTGDVSGVKGVLSSYLPHLLVLIVVIVFVSRVLHYSLRFLRQPLIVCQLITGVLIFSFLPKHQLNAGPSISNDILNPASRRVEHVLGSIGIVFNLFMAGVKLDYTTILEIRKKKALVIGFSSFFFPLAVGLSFFAILRKELRSYFEAKRSVFLLFVLHPLCTTYPITLCDILMELGLLNSELGRLALSSSMMQCFIGWLMLVASNVFRHGQMSLINGFYSLLSFLGLTAFILVVVRPYTLNIVRTTPAYARVRELHILVIMLLVLMLGLVSDMIGFTFPDGPVIMGLTVPQGPPLGTALIERVDLVASEVLLPLVFMHEGFYINWAEVRQKMSLVLRVELIMVATSVTKFVANIAAALYCRMSLKEGVILGLMMNFRGLIDMLNFLSMAGGNMIDNATYTVLVLSTIAISAICVPLVSVYYKPLGVAKNMGRRTVQRLRSHAELRVLTCFYDDNPVPSLLEFIESFSSEETHNSICVYTLHLKELQGCAASSLICHRDKTGDIDSGQMDNVHNHFIALEKSKNGRVTVLPFTSDAPMKTMHQDVCSLILQRSVAFVIVPYPRKNSTAEIGKVAPMRELVPLVVEQASCSVGIMVYHSMTRIKQSDSWQYNIGVLFWGGSDDRETISIASRAARHPGVHLDIFRFRATDDTGSNSQRYGDKEKTSDNEVIAELQKTNDGNDHVTLKEIKVSDLEQVLMFIHTLGEKYNLLIVGRRQENLLRLGEDLEKWTESRELGMIGDILATDVSCKANVLIVQQHK